MGKVVCGVIVYVIFEFCVELGCGFVCVNILIDVGIVWVVVGIGDFFLVVDGKGFVKLEVVGIDVMIGFCVVEVECGMVGFFMC